MSSSFSQKRNTSSRCHAAIALNIRSATRSIPLREGTAPQDAGSKTGSNSCFQSVEVPEAMMACARSSGEVRSG